jgi:membrane-anchored protein YejM (alkaline phosphatase superfamily)
MMKQQDKKSVLFITLDSCRYDTFMEADAPNIKSIGPVYKAKAPGNFTYSSHAAMFMGFTPGIAERAEPFVNPKYGKLFKIAGAGFPSRANDYITLEGKNIVDGFKRIGFLTLGSGAVGWFNPKTETGQHLTKDFDKFYYPGNNFSLAKQLDWLQSQLDGQTEPVFAFLNVGETHVPYYFESAPWDKAYNPCVPFANDKNDANECKRRQRLCLEHVDAKLVPLIDAFKDAMTLVCADHGDCWGEDGLWEHGIHHDKVYEVPLVFKLPQL